MIAMGMRRGQDEVKRTYCCPFYLVLLLLLFLCVFFCFVLFLFLMFLGVLFFGYVFFVGGRGVLVF